MTLTQEPQILLSDPANLTAAQPEGGPDWLRQLRVEAMRAFAETGLPTLRDEEWRQTSLKPVAGTAFRRAPEARAPAAAVNSLRLPGLSGSRLIFVNGRYQAELSSTDGLPDGVTVTSLREAMEGNGALVKAHLGRYAAIGDDPFTALNTAFLEEGTLIHVPDGIKVEEPLYVLSVTLPGDSPVVTHPRMLVIAEADAAVTVVEDYAGDREGVYLTNALTEIVTGARADVHHYLLERESPAAFNISTLKVHQDTESHFSSHSVLLGGTLVRNNVNPVLAGDHCFSLLNGLYVGRERQHLDNHMRVEHGRPHGRSRQFYKGILADHARGVFSGRIIVVQDAQKTDAVQSNGNLLLSGDARAHAKPQLEIYADDVKCTHGATIGQLDAEAIFYLRSRGMSEADARGLLVQAFAGESLDRMELEPVREHVRTLLLDRLDLSRT